uniref:Uncharacterized protein n=1 Tax=Salix viminalis TaxID=40686 RepID=A0A6N2MYM2_SALVM
MDQLLETGAPRVAPRYSLHLLSGHGWTLVEGYRGVGRYHFHLLHRGPCQQKWGKPLPTSQFSSQVVNSQDKNQFRWDPVCIHV